MTDLNLDAVAAARLEVAARVDELRLTRLALSDAVARRAAADAIGDATAAAGAATEAAALDERRRSLIGGVRSAGGAVRATQDALIAALRPELAVGSLSGRHPVFLLPVRLETRFFDGGGTLKVRIFPDQAHVTAHDPAVTEAEVEGLTWYWTHRWPALDAGDAAGRRLADEAWAGLTSRFRPGRAAFLARAYPPENLATAEPAPTFPAIPRRSGEFSVAARATLLPDRWCVLGFGRDNAGRRREVFRVWGAAVPDALAAGPSPDLGPAGQPGGMPEDPDLAWLYNPAEAERLGMLVTVRQSDLVPGARLADGLDRLVALGVDWTLTPEQAAAAVESHLAAHADEGRLGFVPQGVPTNSTGDTRSGFSTDPDRARSVLTPHSAATPPPDAAGPVAATALGLPGGASVLSRIAGADLREQAWQSALLDATWSASGGYYLTEMLDPVTDDPKLEASMREHVASHLRASGPIPALRFGAQPYGILPVLPRGRFEPDVRRRAQADVARVTAAVRGLVQAKVAQVPRLAQVRRREDVDDILLALLQRTPVAWALNFRNLVGPVQRRAISVEWDVISAFQVDVTAMLFSLLGCHRLTQLSELTHDERDHPLNVPLVLEPDPTPEDPKRQSTAYLAEIRSLLEVEDGADILDARKNSVALLGAFIACAAVIDRHKAGKRLVLDVANSVQLSDAMVEYLSRPAERPPSTLRIEAQVVAPAAVGSLVSVPTTPREMGQTVVPQLTGTKTIQQYVGAEYSKRLSIPGLLDIPDDPLHRVNRIGTALDVLVQAPPDQLEWAFRGVLDLYSTRLDAWITSLATCRLSEHRAAAPQGVHIGGWGVVEDLRPDVGQPDSLGYVHTPSLSQAATSAVLRSARLTHREGDARVFDLDLTSRRVRQALRILEGVGQGQRLAALLGYRIERGIQERDIRLAQWILPLRMQCPLRSERPDDPQLAEPVEAVAARDVVDGLAVLKRWADEGDALLVAAGVAAGARSEVGAVLDDVAGLADAVSDVLVAEAVHQATSGNLERSGAALAAHDRQGPPPDPEFVRTPRGGAVLTHRVGVWLPRRRSEPASGWAPDLRSIAEPRLDRWLGAVLGQPSQWSVSARLVRTQPGDNGGSVPQPTGPDELEFDLPPVGLEALGMSALSVVLAARRPGADQPSELEQRLAWHYAGSVEVAALSPGPQDRLDLDTSGLALLMDLAAWAGEVVGSPPLAPEHLASAADLGAGGAGPVAVADVAEAVGRAAAVRDAVIVLADAAQAALDAAVATPGPAADAALSAALAALTEVDGPEALVVADEGAIEQVAAVVSRVRSRIAAADAMPVPVRPVTDPDDLPAPGVAEDAALVRARGVVRLLLGNAQPFLPVLDPLPATAAAVAASLADRGALLAGDPAAVATWLHRSALVRPPLDPLAALLVHAEADGTDVPAELAVAQLPHRPGAPWFALPFGEAGAPMPGAVGLVLHAPDGVTPGEGAAGLLVDGWTETVPATSETTAVTLHYDAPGARAPQAMLLAVHPELDPDRWDFDSLLGCVNEAVDLAQLRTLGSAELAGLSTVLPALFLPDTYTRDVPGVRLRELLAVAEALEVGGLSREYVLGKLVTGNG